MTSSLLSGIINPTDAGSLPQRFAGIQQAARQQETGRMSTELSGKILSETLASKLGKDSMAKLNRINPTAGLELIKQLRLQGKEELEWVAGMTIEQQAIIDGGGTPEDVSKNMASKGLLFERMGMTELAQKAMAASEAMKNPQTQQETLRNLKISAQAFSGEDESVGVIRKEVRADLKKQLLVVRKDTQSVEENFTKIQNLLKQVGSGNRIATAQALIAMIKLGDDSTVRSDELAAGLNRQNPIAAVTAFLKGEGVSGDVINSVTSVIDPLNPLTLKTEDVRSVANSIASARIPAIQASFGEAVELGTGNLTSRGFKSVISDSLTKRVGNLSLLIGGSDQGGSGAPSGGLSMSDAELDAEIKALGGE